MFFGRDTLMRAAFYLVEMRAVYRCNHADEFYIFGSCTSLTAQNPGYAFRDRHCFGVFCSAVRCPLYCMELAAIGSLWPITMAYRR